MAKGQEGLLQKITATEMTDHLPVNHALMATKREMKNLLSANAHLIVTADQHVNTDLRPTA